jgi:pimeloyl-ACP methyl ester carboxylesterase
LAQNPDRVDARPAPIHRDRVSGRPLPPVGTGTPSLDRTRYVWDVDVAGVARCAIIDAPNPTAVTKPAALIFFHGRGGDAAGTEDLLNLAGRIPEVVVVYAEGQDGVHRLDGRGWEIRFPHAHYVCGEGVKDLPYVEAILDHLAVAHDIDKSRVFFAGHSNGGFFSLSLAEIMADRLRGVVAIGAYTSYAPAPWLINCSDPYGDGFTGVPARRRTATLDVLNRGIEQNPVDSLLAYGRKEAVVRRAPNWSPRCDTFTYLRHSIIQLTLKNGSEAPKCGGGSNFMTPLGRQVFAPVGRGSAVTEVEIYDGTHSLRSIADDAAGWIAGFVRQRL